MFGQHAILSLHDLFLYSRAGGGQKVGGAPSRCCYVVCPTFLNCWVKNVECFLSRYGYVSIPASKFVFLAIYQKTHFSEYYKWRLKVCSCQLISWKNKSDFYSKFEGGPRDNYSNSFSLSSLIPWFWKIPLPLWNPPPSRSYLVGMFSMIIHLTSLAWIVQKNHPIRCEMRQ